MNFASRHCLHYMSAGRCSLQFARCLNNQKASVNSCPLHESEEAHFNCWNCTKRLECLQDRFFCHACNRIQPPAKCSNYFQYLGLGDPSFDLDPRQLTQNYRQLQTRIHPDKFAAKSHMEVDYSDQQSSLINKAYQTLSKPLTRAIYLLEMLGAPLSETSQSSDAGADPDLLIQILELNEKVEDLGSSPEDQDQLRQILYSLSERTRDFEQTIANAFREQNLDLVKQSVTKLKYYQNVKDKIMEKLPDDV